MAIASTTNVDMEMGMVDENEMNSSSQKRPTMAQVTISQKKAKGKLVVEPKRPPFWLGFQAMNWTNRLKDYPVDSMELISELIRKGMELMKLLNANKQPLHSLLSSKRMAFQKRRWDSRATLQPNSNPI